MPGLAMPAPSVDAPAETWLGATSQLDLGDPKLRITAQKLTQARQTWAERAAAIHAYVRSLPFAAAADSSVVRASEVLRRRSGDCHSKGLLFTALCRSAGLPARLHFVGVRTRFLAGLLDEGPSVLPHAVGQVQLGGRWISTDAYVVDPVLFAHAKKLLRDQERDTGWGLVREARGAWDGSCDSLQQFRPADIVRDYGVHHDPAGFYLHGGAGRGAWLLVALGAHLLNRRVAHLRHAVTCDFPTSDPSAP
jgi:transglutaminase-like putative cysteine protease